MTYMLRFSSQYLGLFFWLKQCRESNGVGELLYHCKYEKTYCSEFGRMIFTPNFVEAAKSLSILLGGPRTSWFQKSGCLSVWLLVLHLVLFLVVFRVILIDPRLKKIEKIWKACLKRKIERTVKFSTWEFITLFFCEEPQYWSALWYRSIGNIECKRRVLNLFCKLARGRSEAATPRWKCHENEYQRPWSFVAFPPSPRVTLYILWRVEIVFPPVIMMSRWRQLHLQKGIRCL